MIGQGSEMPVMWALAVTVGYPLLAVATVEARRHAAPRFPEFARLLGLLHVSVFPVTALYLLLRNVAQLSADAVSVKVVLTALAIASINAVLDALNSVMRSETITGGVARRIPGLLLDILRIFLVLIASAFVASGIWAVDLGSLLAALGVGSIVLGLALQDTLSGLFAGVSLLSGRQFKEGDWIEFGEASGKIVKMDWRSVTVETLDDERLMVIPNSELSGGVFTILSSSSRSFGQNLNVSFSYDSPPARVMAAIEEAILSVDIILADPSYDIDLMELSDKGMVYEVTIHTATREEGEEAATLFFRRLWYICAREDLRLAGAVNRRYRAITVPETPARDVANLLAETAIFLPSAKGFEALAAAARIRPYDAGEKLVAAGQPFSRLFLVISGQVSVMRSGTAHVRSLQNLGPGEFFVTRAFLTGAPATVDLVAEGEVAALCLDRLAVTEFLNANPQLARLFEMAIDGSESGLSLAAEKMARLA